MAPANNEWRCGVIGSGSGWHRVCSTSCAANTVKVILIRFHYYCVLSKVIFCVFTLRMDVPYTSRTTHAGRKKKRSTIKKNESKVENLRENKQINLHSLCSSRSHKPVRLSGMTKPIRIHTHTHTYARKEKSAMLAIV